MTRHQPVGDPAIDAQVGRNIRDSGLYAVGEALEVDPRDLLPGGGRRP